MAVEQCPDEGDAFVAKRGLVKGSALSACRSVLVAVCKEMEEPVAGPISIV